MPEGDYDNSIYNRADEEARPFIDRPELVCGSNPGLTLRLYTSMGVLEGTHQFLSESELMERELPDGDGEVPGISYLIGEED